MNLTEFARLVTPEERQRRLGQAGRVLWLTGLSGSGKSTIAFNVERSLIEQGKFATVLDGDSVRMGLCQGLDFTPEGRQENLRRVAHVARLLADSGVIVLCAFVSPFGVVRQMVRTIIEPIAFDLVHIDTSLEICEARDSKGLYARARRGEIPDFTGISSPYERPVDAQLTLDGDQSVEAMCQQLLKAI
jgi:adenylylsulfate kinase